MEIFNVDLGYITRSILGMPNIGGKLFANMNFEEAGSNYRINCNLNVDSLTYDNSHIGNESIELTYTLKKNDYTNRDKPHSLRIFLEPCNVFNTRSDILAAIVDTSAAGRFRETVICHREKYVSIRSAFLAFKLFKHILIATRFHIIYSAVGTINDQRITPMQAS